MKLGNLGTSTEHGVLRSLLCCQARPFSLWIVLWNVADMLLGALQSPPVLCRFFPEVLAVSEAGFGVGLMSTSPLNSAASVSFNCGQPLYCLLRKIIILPHHKLWKYMQSFPCFSSEPYEFVSLEWLQKWLDESTPTKPIDNHACLCSHDKLHPDKISIMKRISEYAADIFYSRYGGGPRLTGKSDVCFERVITLNPQFSGPLLFESNLLSQVFHFTESIW